MNEIINSLNYNIPERFSWVRVVFCFRDSAKACAPSGSIPLSECKKKKKKKKKKNLFFYKKKKKKKKKLASFCHIKTKTPTYNQCSTELGMCFASEIWPELRLP